MSFDDDLLEIEGLIASTKLIEEIRKEARKYYGDDKSVVMASEHSRRMTGHYDVMLSRPNLEETGSDFARRMSNQNPELDISQVTDGMIGISKMGRR